MLITRFRMLTLNPTKVKGPSLQKMLQIADFGATGELGSSDVQLLSQPLSQGKNVDDPVSFDIPAVPLISDDQTAEELFFDCPFLTHWEDELLLQRTVSRAFRNNGRRKSLCCGLRR